MMTVQPQELAGAQHGKQPISPEALSRLMAQLADRIDAALDEECRIIASATAPMIDALTERKSQLALELSRLLQHAGGWVPDADTQARLDATRTRLQRNAAQLRRHIDAVDGIISTLAHVQESAVSDGTYTRSAPKRARIR